MSKITFINCGKCSLACARWRWIENHKVRFHKEIGWSTGLSSIKWRDQYASTFVQKRSKTSQFLGTRQTFLLLWILLGYIRHVHCFGEPAAFPCRNYLGRLALFNIKTVTSKLLTASRRCCSALLSWIPGPETTVYLVHWCIRCWILGAVLTKGDGHDEERPVCLLSRKCQGVEVNYPTSKKDYWQSNMSWANFANTCTKMNSPLTIIQQCGAYLWNVRQSQGCEGSNS